MGVFDKFPQFGINYHRRLLEAMVLDEIAFYESEPKYTERHRQMSKQFVRIAFDHIDCIIYYAGKYNEMLPPVLRPLLAYNVKAMIENVAREKRKQFLLTRIRLGLVNAKAKSRRARRAYKNKPIPRSPLAN